jgi:hypothetical protein
MSGMWMSMSTRPKQVAWVTALRACAIASVPFFARTTRAQAFSSTVRARSALMSLSSARRTEGCLPVGAVLRRAAANADSAIGAGSASSVPNSQK